MTTTFDGAALRVDNVVKRFGNKYAVNKLSFTANPGTVLALLGPNGAGKTTTIEMCEGFQHPTSGSISVLGLDPATEPEKVRARIGIMLQGGGSYSGIRVREMLELAAKYNRNPHDPNWLIELLGLEGVAKTTYKRLSGGQQQRLSLALAIIGRPELVFLDEPTAGMDAQSRLAVWDLISHMRDDGTTIILTTHLMDEAERLADDIVIIDHGHVVATGTPQELTRGTSAETVEFETTSELSLDQLPAEARVRQIRPLHYQLDCTPTPELVAKLTAAAAEQNVLITRLGVKQRNLEEVFLELTGRELRS